MTTLNIDTLSLEKKRLHQPSLDEVAGVLRKGLTYNFNEIVVEVVDSPDLTQQPFTLAASGLNGNPSLLEIGGNQFLLPLVQREKLYDIKAVVRKLGYDSSLIIGAGAGPYPYAGVNCEGIYNLKITNNNVDSQSRFSKVLSDGKPQDGLIPNAETRIALLASLFLSEGKPGKVLKVYAKKRTGSDDFIASIRKTLAAHYKNDVVGLGGAFLLKEGKAKEHIMADFLKTPITTKDGLNQWLTFHDFSAPLVSVGTLVTSEYDLDLRVQHFHSFSHHGEAGHYHYDITPDTVEYLGYFNLGQYVYRLDKPTSSFKIRSD